MRLLDFERRLTRVLEAALAGGMLCMFGIIVVLVMMRYLLQAGLVGANELATVLFVHLSAIGAAVAIGREEHIRLDLVHRKLGVRGKRLSEIASLMVVGGLNLVLAERSLAWIAVTGHTVMPATQAPRVLAQVAVPVGCALAAIYCCTRIAAKLREEPER